MEGWYPSCPARGYGGMLYPLLPSQGVWGSAVPPPAQPGGMGERCTPSCPAREYGGALYPLLPSQGVWGSAVPPPAQPGSMGECCKLPHWGWVHRHPEAVKVVVLLMSKTMLRNFTIARNSVPKSLWHAMNSNTF